jgi:hypothetical protein
MHNLIVFFAIHISCLFNDDCKKIYAIFFYNQSIQTTEQFYRRDLVAAANKKWAIMHNFRQVNGGIRKAMTVRQNSRKK